MNIKYYFSNFFSKGHERTLKAKKNIFASFFIKGANIVVGLALVPITINYLNPTKYGIWITLNSIIAWFGFFDIGLGNGLRNRFAEALAKNETKLAKTYVSTTYAILSIIIGGILFIFYTLNHYLNWNKILNVSNDISSKSELNLLVLFVFTFFCLRFVFKLITTILMADQRPAKASMFDLIGKIIALIAIYILTKFTFGSLLYIGIIMSGAPVLVLIVSSVWFFNGKYKAYKPSFKNIDFSKSKDLLNLGIKFFIIQIAVVLLYQTNNIIISQLFGPAEVTPYNVAFKYFNVLLMIFSIIITPFWSAITDAWIKKELDWIKNVIRKLFYIWSLFLFLGFIMLFMFSEVLKFWIGANFTIPFSISILTLFWVQFNMWNSIFSHFFNGVGELHLQMILGIFTAIVNVPLAIFLGKKLGVEGVLIANLIVLFPSLIIYPLKYLRIMRLKSIIS